MPCGNIGMIFLGAFLASFTVAWAGPLARLSAVNYPVPALKTMKAVPTTFRGGSSDPSHRQYIAQNKGQQQQHPQNENLPEKLSPLPNVDDEGATFRERVDAWRDQLEQSLFSEILDNQENLNLIVSASRFLIFLMLAFRFDYKLMCRLSFIRALPLMIHFIANMVGAIASIISTSHASKRRLKAILNLDKLVEAFLIILNIRRIVRLHFSSLSVPWATYEFYIFEIYYSVLFYFLTFLWDTSFPDASSSINKDDEELDHDGAHARATDRDG